MRLTNIIKKVYSQPWAILPETHQAIQNLVEAKLEGNALEPLMEDAPSTAATIIGKVAVIPIQGIILPKASGLEAACGAFSLETFRRELKGVARNEAIETIILDVDSPGGINSGVPEAADLIAKVSKEKQVIAYTGNEMCSAAYWLASQATGILASKSSSVGSVGVYLALLDTSRALEMQGVKVELFKAGKFKAIGISGKSLTDEERELLQKRVDDAYAEFTGYITGKRKIDDEYMQGQVFTGKEAVQCNLIDGVQDDFEELVEFLNAN